MSATARSFVDADREAVPWIDPATAARRLRPLGGLGWLDAGRPDEDGEQTSWLVAAPSAELRLFARPGALAELERFVARSGALAVGWLGYDLGRVIERLPTRARLDLPLPDLHVRAYPAALRLGGGRATLVGESRARARLAAALGRPAPPARPGRLSSLEAEMDAAGHAAGVARIRGYLEAGDVYQVNLARRFRGRVDGDALSLYERLRARSPAPLGAYLEAEDHAILSNSPERFLRVRGRRIEALPIKGTRPRGRTADEDAALAAELRADDKERAEHVMIVDLLRNDLGRVCEAGSVAVAGFMRLLSVATVHHLVSTVHGRLLPRAGLEAILSATFPGGSITGAPKVRAMEIIEELEPVRRGPYTGALGWFAPGGELDLSIAIRTGVLLGAPERGGDLVVHAGGGIVADSRAEAELAETEAKVLAWRGLGDP